MMCNLASLLKTPTLGLRCSLILCKANENGFSPRSGFVQPFNRSLKRTRGYFLAPWRGFPAAPLSSGVGLFGVRAFRCRLGLVVSIKPSLRNTYVICIIDAWILNSTLEKPPPTSVIIAWPSARRKPAYSTHWPWCVKTTMPKAKPVLCWSAYQTGGGC